MMEDQVWITPKAAAAHVGITVRRFRAEWVPEDGPAQVVFRVTNGREGKGRRIEVLLASLLQVLEERTTPRAS